LKTYMQPLKITLNCEEADRPLVNLLNEAVVKVNLEPSDGFLALMEKLDFTRRGSFSWAVSLKDNSAPIRKFLKEYATDFLPNTLVSMMNKNDVTYLTPNSTVVHQNQTHAQNALQYHSSLLDSLQEAVGTFPTVAPDPEYARTIGYQQRNYGYGGRNNNAINADAATAERFRKENAALGGVGLEVAHEMLWIRLFPTVQLATQSELIYMPKVRNVKRSSNKYLPIRQVVTLLDKLGETWSKDIFDEEVSEKVFELIELNKDVVTVGYAPNMPAKVILTRGANVVGTNFNGYKANKETKVTIAKALDLQEKVKRSRAKTAKPDFLFHPALTDIVNMTNAKPYEGEMRLKPYQKEAVGLHLSTEIGYLQTCSPGMGKTVIQLVAMKAKAEKIPNYRGIVLCEANVRTQWEEEAAKWFPEATVFSIESQQDADSLAEVLGEEGPVIVIASYNRTLLAFELMEKRQQKAEELALLTYEKKLEALISSPIEDLTVGSLLLDTLWEDICADEAVIVRNGSSKQAKAMWALRKNSKVATALTATPLNKSPDDIGRLISWIRNDRNMFTGAPLAEQYDVTTAKGGKQLFDVFGPLIFRRDTSEIADEMPTAKPDVHILEPNAAEKALATAAEHELKRCYMELMAAVEEVEKTADAKDNAEAIKEVKENLKAANGAWLGGTQLARMATSDPTALLGSQSVGAALLAGQGLIEAALVEEPTKRKKFIELAMAKVAQGKQVLVFTEFVDVAKTLVKALQDNGINAKPYTGQNTKTRDVSRKEFQDGKIDVLVCTKAAERGLTLHKASTIVHYDLPWTLEKIIQRTGRGIRIGSEHEMVDIIFLVMQGTIEERIALRLMELGIASTMILDNSRGIDVTKTETTSAMGGLLVSMGAKSDKKSLRSFGKEFLGVAA